MTEAATESDERVLVAYGSRHGATAEIAEAIAAELREQGVAAECLAAHDVSELAPYRAVVLGSAVYMKHWQRDARKLFTHHAQEFAAKPFWLFSSGPVGEEPADPEWSEPHKLMAEAEQLGAREHVVFGGKVPEEGFIAKAMREGTPEDKRDIRDWAEIRAWATKIAAELKAAN